VTGTALIEISVPVDGEAAEAVCELFERHGGGAVVEVRVHDSPPFGGPMDVGPPLGGPLGPAPPAGGAPDAAAAPRSDRTTWVRTYLPAGDVEARRRVEVGLWYLGRIHPIPEAAIRTLAEANWAEAWKAHYSPIEVGERFRIVPAWIDEGGGAAGGRLVIRLDPGMAFGTGLHPTTQLCLAALERLTRPGAAVLDVGTGSGILAIGAARLGAARVVGVDIDPKAAEIAAGNFALNGVAADVRVGTVEAGGSDPFDIVVANLLAPTIVDLAAALAARLRPGGHLIASGILAGQAGEVAAALAAAGMGAIDSAREGDWVALLAVRGDDTSQRRTTGSPIAGRAADASPSPAEQ